MANITDQTAADITDSTGGQLTDLAVPSARYWAVLVTTTHTNGSFVGFAEVVGRGTPGGADAFTGGTGSAQSEFDATTNAAINAYDKSASTKWTAGTAVPVRTQYQLPIANSIQEFALTNRNDVLGNGAGLAFSFQYSPDGTTWTTAWTATTPDSWALGETRTFTDPAYVAPNVSFVANVGTFSLSGQPANLTVLRGMVAALGTFAYTGQNANLTRAPRFAADLGTFSYSGQNANLTLGIAVVSSTLTAALGTFTYSGQASVLRVATPAAPGSFALTGQNATLTGFGIVASTLTASVGLFSYGGQIVTLTAPRYFYPDAVGGAVTGLPDTALDPATIAIDAPGAPVEVGADVPMGLVAFVRDAASPSGAFATA